MIMRHPDWIKVRLTETHKTKKLLRTFGVSTVCEEAMCPNQGECFSGNTATFMILGDRCTRNCSFCAVLSDKPLPVDSEEPERVARAARSMGLKFVVITSVTRDDLPDGGAMQFARTVRALKETVPDIKVEVLTPDFKGDAVALRSVIDSGPDVFNHNIETVPRLYQKVRPDADYDRSLYLLRTARDLAPDIITKSGLMVGLGEREEEVLSVMNDLIEAGCVSLTIGQYLQPRRKNLPVYQYIHPEVFEQYRKKGLAMGFRAVASSPLTRSSMNAEQILEEIKSKDDI